jgi:hypothetical protein
MFKEGPLKLYKIEFGLELIKWLLNGRLVNLNFLSENYIRKDKSVVQKNDQAERKSPGHIILVRALGLNMCKEVPPKLYKIEFAFELTKWLMNCRLVKLMFFP